MEERSPYLSAVMSCKASCNAMPEDEHAVSLQQDTSLSIGKSSSTLLRLDTVDWLVNKQTALNPLGERAKLLELQ